MDFWQAQRRARKLSFLYIFLFVVLATAIACLGEWILRQWASQSYNPPLPYFGILFVCVTFAVAWWHYMDFKLHGGSAVAASMGARSVSRDSANAKEQQLLNIIDEVAIASGVKAPQAYVMNAQQINAFAAGIHEKDAVIAVTQGALDKLSREELQGVLAHEFGHLANQDMLIGTRLAALVLGFFFMINIGFRLLDGSLFFGGRRRRDKGQNSLAMAALIVILAGVITYFAGQILKSMVSRQREYLADASSVQYTRNPAGLIGALQKIAQDETEDMPKSGMAFSHLYFNDASFLSRLFATHPPLENRIARLQGKLK